MLSPTPRHCNPTQPDSPELQLDPPAIQQDGSRLVVDPCKEAKRAAEVPPGEEPARICLASTQSLQASGVMEEQTTPSWSLLVAPAQGPRLLGTIAPVEGRMAQE